MDLRICEYPECRKEFQPKSALQTYCHPDHQLQHRLEKDKEHRKIRKEIEMELRGMKKHTIALIAEWYKKMDMEHAKCDVCGKSFKDQMKDFGVPLHMQCNTQARDYTLMKSENWLFFCTEHYCEVLALKKEEQTLK